MTYLNNNKNNLFKGKIMDKITDNLHDYINMLAYVSMVVENETISSIDVAFSDMKRTVIKSFPEQVLTRMQINAQNTIDELELDFEDDGE